MQTAATILTFNRPKLLKMTLDALFSQTRPLDLVIVVDAGSTDNTPALLRELQNVYGEKLVVHQTTDRGASQGFCDAMEFAYKKTKADWIWVLDDDAAPYPDALERLLENPVAQDARTGALCPLVVQPDGKVFRPNVPCRVDFSTFEFLALDVDHVTAPTKTDTTSFEGILIHRKVFEKIGFHPTEYFFWFDDTDYTLTISRHFDMWFVPSARVTHLSEFNEKEVTPPLFNAPIAYYEWPQCWRMYYRSRNYYYLLRRHAATSVFMKKTLKAFMRESIGTVLLRQDHLLERLLLSSKALVHGTTGRMGQRIRRQPPFSRIGSFF